MGKSSFRLVVDRSIQGLEIWQDKILEITINCITGTMEKPTPKGNFFIYKKIKDYHSKTYDAAMPHSMFFYKGCAIHAIKGAGTLDLQLGSMFRASGLSDRGSHGCVGVSEFAAKTLFEMIPVNTRVIVRGKMPS